MSPKQTDLRTRIGELEATVRGLTQELVDANERIRHLEAALEDEGTEHRSARRRREPGVRQQTDGSGAEEATTQKDDEREAGGETAPDLDDIIVA